MIHDLLTRVFNMCVCACVLRRISVVPRFWTEIADMLFPVPDGAIHLAWLLRLPVSQSQLAPLLLAHPIFSLALLFVYKFYHDGVEETDGYRWGHHVT